MKKTRNPRVRLLAPGITATPGVISGRPALEGTRIPVTLVLGHLAAGDSIDEVARAYDLKPRQVRAALDYACRLARKAESGSATRAKPRARSA